MSATAETWRTIESAPRDGTSFLAVRLDGGEPTYNVIWWDDTGDSQFSWGMVDGDRYHNDWPTHWMPLPPPPRDSGASE